MIRFSSRFTWYLVVGILMALGGSAFAEIRYQSLWWLPSNYTEIGKDIDFLYYVIFWLTLVVFFITEFLLFYWVVKFRDKPGRKALYLHGNNTYEIVWTTIPALIFFGLAFYSNNRWYTYFPSDGAYGTAYNSLTKHLPTVLADRIRFEGKLPDNKMVIEITAEQFGFNVRYPGEDGILGQHSDKLISLENKLGLVTDDPAGKDDIILYNEIVIPIGRAVQVQLRSRDVIHS
ncbi:MAG: cytochrome c oxidase subunit II transmembrane domain-containing protein, partial [Verrucomicrobiota bacterium]